MSVFADLEFAIDAGSYLYLTDHIIGATYPNSAQFEAIYAWGDEWPRHYLIRTTGVLSISGLIYELGTPKTFKSASGEALFAVVDKELDIFGPCGYVRLNDRNLVTPNGVIQVAGTAPGTQINGLENWLYGDLLPAQYNANRPSTHADWDQAPAGAWCMIHVVKRGSVTALEVKYTRSGNDYTLSADTMAGQVDPQLKLGQLVDGSGDAIPDTGPGTWRISVTGSTSDAEIYIGVAA